MLKYNVYAVPRPEPEGIIPGIAEGTVFVSEKIPEKAIARLNSLFEALTVIAGGAYVFLCNLRYDYSRWSRSAVETFGLPSEYMPGAGDIWLEHIHPEDRECYKKSIDAIFSGKDDGHDMQYRAQKPDGIYEVCTCRGIVMRDENGEPAYFGGVIINHSEQNQIDTLTGLRNQYGFFEDLQSHIANDRAVRICVLGITPFTQVNDIYGYSFGNLVLRRFARRLFENVGNTGNVYRLDGAKFAIVSATLDEDRMEREYEELRTAFGNGVDIDGRHIILSLSSGLLSLNNNQVDVQAVYSCLNFAFTESKVRWQGEMVEFRNDLNEDKRQRLEKLNDIRISITQDYKGFSLYYQPVVDAESGHPIGAEALIRWENESFGSVMPDHFIPLLERDRLFPQLGRWIMKTALLDAKKAIAVRPDFVINVNLSYTQIEKPDFVDMVLQLLKETEFPADHLCLEITERCRLLDLEMLNNIIIQLKAQGVRFALDDFGTGFSSIGIMKSIPFDTIKIDHSFVSRIEEDETERRLVEHFTSVAALFGAKVCVEGVETEGMRDILQNYRVHSFQGFYFGKPMEFERFMCMLKAD